MLYKRCKHPDGKCRCAFSYSFQLHGTLYRRSTRTANRQSAGRIEERRRVAILENRDVDQPTKFTLRDHVRDYVAHTAKTNVTAYKDANVLDRLVRCVGDRQLDRVSPFDVEKWKRDRVATVSRSTVNRELNIIRGCFSRAVEWKRLGVSPLSDVKNYDVDGRRIRVLSDDELRLVMTQADPFVALLCRVTLECLPRLSEVLGIRREHIGSSWVEVRRKGGAVDRLAITSELRGALLTSSFAGVSVPAASQRVRTALKRLSITGASHHTFRHTGVTLMLEAGVNPRAIQKLAGWSSLRMLERYGHARDAELVRAVSSNAAYLAALGTKSITEPAKASNTA